jgi:hypothetical protein
MNTISPALSAKLQQLRPVTFHYKTDPKGYENLGEGAGKGCLWTASLLPLNRFRTRWITVALKRGFLPPIP